MPSGPDQDLTVLKPPSVTCSRYSRDRYASVNPSAVVNWTTSTFPEASARAMELLVVPKSIPIRKTSTLARHLLAWVFRMISFSNINKQYGRQLVFVEASFQLNPGEKVGLVGPNGAGKTTLFRMVVGEESPDDGDVSVPKKITIGYFRQDVEEMSGRSVLDEAIAGSGRLGDLHHELEALQHAMEDPAQAGDMDRILERFGEVQEEYDHLGGYSLESQAREVPLGLGFDNERIDGDVGELSGGWKMRVAMARVLLGRPDVLLMDEPTNHLDIESIVWLEDLIKSLPGALLMTSHDREFMNRVVSKIAEIDGGEITVYSGN